MRKANVYVKNILAGILEEENRHHYRFSYIPEYTSSPVSLTMPINNKIYEFEQFPPFFEGLLPEGILLDALLKQAKLDKSDYFGQLMLVGKDVVGDVTIEEIS